MDKTGGRLEASATKTRPPTNGVGAPWATKQEPTLQKQGWGTRKTSGHSHAKVKCRLEAGATKITQAR